MAEDIYDIPAPQRKAMLESMLHSPAFALLCDAFDAKRDREIDEKIFDLKTDDATTRVLKTARPLLTGTNHPRKILEAMIRATANEKPKTPHQT